MSLSLRLSAAGSGCARRVAFLVATIMTLPTMSSAQDSEPKVTRIEEDWVVQIDEPDPDQNAPQIINVMSPLPHANQLHFVFELNHVTLPRYDAGGMQVQCWYDDFWITYRNCPDYQVLTIPQEQITYTLRMKVDDNYLSFEVLNGQSETWSSFGGEGYLKYSIQTSIDSLEGYSSSVSASRSKIGYASNRVKKFQLKEVRYYAGETLVQRDTTGRILHELTSSDGL